MSMEQHGMDDEARAQIQSLKDALDVALCNSFEVANAMDVLRRCGRQVQIEIDAVLIDENNAGDSAPATQALEPYEPGGTSTIFSAEDALFLQAFKISPA